MATHVLGYLVEKISGQPFADYPRRVLFEPLGMVDTGFFVADAQAERLCACYAPTPAGGLALQDDPAASAYLQAPALASGGSGLVSTAHDYLRLCRMLLNGGTLDGDQVLSPKTVELMTLNHLPGGKTLDPMSRSTFSEAVYPGLGFGLGFAVTQDLASTMMPGSVGDYFWGGGASTAFWIDPAEDLIVVFMTLWFRRRPIGFGGICVTGSMARSASADAASSRTCARFGATRARGCRARSGSACCWSRRRRTDRR